MLNCNTSYTPPVQRALVLQGGGALGAYQVGAFKALYEKLEEEKDNKDNGDNHHYLISLQVSLNRSH